VLGVPTPPLWADMAAAPYTPLVTTLTPAGAVHQEYTGYDGRRIIQQSDVALLQWPLGMTFAPDQAARDLDYWLNVTDMGGMFTGDTVYAIGFLRLGLAAAAAAQWGAVWDHVDPAFLVFREIAGGSGGTHHFITGANSFLQVLAYGHAGLALERVGVAAFTHPQPSLPAELGVTALALRGAALGGGAYDFRWNATAVCASTNPGAAAAHGGGGGGAALELAALQAGTVTPRPPPPAAVCVRLQPVEGRVAGAGAAAGGGAGAGAA
jgi:hypothetical protein